MSSPEVQVRLGRVWRRQGKAAQAIASFRRVLVEAPGYAPAYVELAAVLLDEGRAAEAVTVCRQGLAVAPNVAELHKGLANALVAAEGLGAVFREYRLTRADDRPLRIAPGDVLACVVVRNEAARLPFFLDYYRQLGVARFLVVDNASTDGTADLLAAPSDVTVWRSDLAFSRANFGAGWFEPILRAHGVGHWTLIVDADEMLVYPDCETRPLPALCAELDGAGKRALDGVLLDMYAARPIRDTHYAPGQDPRQVCPYFDRQFYHAAYAEWTPYRNQLTLVGGARQRVFGAGGDYVISKVPLVRYDTDVVLIGGQHWTSLPPEQIAERGCALLHFKYMAAFPAYVRQEVARGEHFGGAMQYEEYARALAEDDTLSLYDPAHSIRYRDSHQLVELGVIRATDAGETEPAELVTLDILRIMPLPAATPRPFWSVMLTAYDRTAYLERALRSVLDQADDDMHIEVINDGADPRIQAELAAIVDRVGAGRAAFTALPRNVGHPHIFNVCVERAQGRWLHLLHDDDWVAPGFYAALRAGIETAPDVGMAVCRHVRVDEQGVIQWESWLERETPGVIDGWLERIALACRVQFAAAVVRRDVFEVLGGFATGVGSTFDWDMWKRIAVRYPVWYEPTRLAHFCQGPLSLTHGLLRSGGQVADTRRSVEASRAYLPPAVAEDLTRRAADQCAVYALDVARRYLRAGDSTAAAANAREGLRAARSAGVRAALRDVLMRVEASA